VLVISFAIHVPLQSHQPDAPTGLRTDRRISSGKYSSRSA
jgi:hypothetical protein